MLRAASCRIWASSAGPTITRSMARPEAAPGAPRRSHGSAFWAHMLNDLQRCRDTFEHLAPIFSDLVKPSITTFRAGADRMDERLVRQMFGEWLARPRCRRALCVNGRAISIARLGIVDFGAR